MVKLPTSSKAPGLPRPSTAPLGPGPCTFCHASGAIAADSDEQPWISAAAASARPAQRANPMDALALVMSTPRSAPRSFAPAQTPRTKAVGRRPLWDERRGADDAALAQLGQDLVCLLERMARGELEELLAVAPGEIRHRPEHALAPQQLVREGGNVAHVDAAADDYAALSHRAQRQRNQRAHRREEDGRVQRLRRHRQRRP